VIERAVLVSPGDVIRPVDLPEALREAVGPDAAPARDRTVNSRPRVESGGDCFKSRVRCFEVRLLRRALERTNWNKTAAAQQLQMPLRTLMHKVQAFGLRRGGQPTDDTMPVLSAITAEDENPRPFKVRVREYETELLVGALEQAAWNKAEAARQLRLPLSTMLYKIKAYELETTPN
jgi:DNA-binding NtrC family response regulator